MSETRTFHLDVLPGTYAICRLSADALVPGWATQGVFYSVTHTRNELSLVCTEDSVPEEVPCEAGWVCLKVRGPLAFNMTGVLASLAETLAKAGISLFAISTFDTDYLLVKREIMLKAISVLEQAGHQIFR